MTKQGSSAPAIEARKLAYQYSDGTKALSEASFAIPAGSRTALLGPNGAGKSTLLLCLAGLFQPTSGELKVDGISLPTGLGKARIPSLLGRVGLVFQDPDDQLFEMSVSADIAYGPRAMGLSADEVEERTRDAMRRMHLSDLAERPPHHLSLGQKRRVAIAGVLAMKPAIVILDEPTAFLDPAGVADLGSVLDQLHQDGLTLIVATHDVDFAAEWADHLLILQKGSVFASGSRDLLASGQILTESGLRLPLVSQVFSEGCPPNLADPDLVYPPVTVEQGQALWLSLLDKLSHK